MQIFNGLAIAALLQGIIMALIIRVGPGRAYAAKIWTWIVVVLALLNGKIILHTTGLWQTRLFHYFPLAIDTTLPALFILYVRALTGKPAGVKVNSLILLPTVIFLLHAIVVYAGALLQPARASADVFAAKLFYNEVKTAEDIIAVVYSVFAWMYCFTIVQRYRRWLFLTQSNSSFEEYAWVRNLLIVSGILILALAFITAVEDFLPAHSHFAPLVFFYIYLSALTWYWSLKGFMLYRNASPTPQPVITDSLPIRGSQVPQEALQAVTERVVAAMEQRHLYLDPALTLKMLAIYTGDTATIVSAAINQGTGKNFRTFVNGYRVAAVKKRLEKPSQQLSLLGVAIECGFNSEASFYRIFRQLEGISPNEYLRQQK